MTAPTVQLKFIGIDDVTDTVPMSKSSIYRLVRKGEFPPSIKFGEKSCMFLKHEIEHYLVSIIQKKDKKETVKNLMTMRKELPELVNYPI